ncbi:MAG: hypothetical protein KGL90_06585 [Burkholderiales bacterium]|nr:hypothetical protein [Burkholderiales bacterium]
MKLSKIVIAAVAVCGATQVMAAGVTRLTGSSASSINVVRGLTNLCASASGTATVFKTTTSTSSLGNQFTVQCTADFPGTTVNEARVNVAGGSESAVTNAAAFPTSTNTGFLVPTGACATIATAGTEALSFLAAGQMKSCGTTLAESAKSDGGYLDVEGPVFSSTKYDAADFTPAGFSQVFGIAVNSTLYNALQTYQKTAAGGAIVASTCAAGDTTPACQPSLSRAQVASLINADNFNAAKTTGGAFLVPGSAVSKISYCMRPQSSGTQQSAQLYFLGAALNGTLGGADLVVAPGVSLAKYSSILNNGSSDVKSCLNSATDFRMGALSLESNPIGGTDTYRFVKLNEVPGTEGVSFAAGASQTTTAIAGRYDYVYELSAYCPGGLCSDILTALNGAVTAGTSSPGIFLTGVESKFGRAGNSASPYASR